MGSKNKPKSAYLSVTALTMIVFVGVFGFGNLANNFKETGTTSASLFLIGALLYFLPISLIMAEFGAYAKDRKAGIYSWIEVGLGKRAAYYGIWCYFVANIFYLPTLASRVPVYLSFVFTGGANLSNVSVAVWGAISLLITLLVGLRFEKGFSKISTATGYLSLVVAGIFLVTGLVIFTHLFKAPATNLHMSDLVVQVNSKKELASGLGTFAWVLFAYSGSELIGPYVDRVKNPERNFMRGLLISALLIGALYILGIISIAAYGTVAQFKSVSLVNATISIYAFMAHFLHLGIWFVQIMGAAYTIITLVALVLWSMTLTRAVFSEVPAGTFPAWLTRKTKNGVLRNGLIFQTSLAFLFILITILGSVGEVYYTIYDMTTMALIVPYLFLCFAYIRFRHNKMVSSYQICKSDRLAQCIGWVVVTLNVVSIVFAGYDMSKPIKSQMHTIWLYYGGLALFLVIGYIIKVTPFDRFEKQTTE